MKTSPLPGRRYLQYINLTKDSYPEYRSNSYTSIKKKPMKEKRAKKWNRHFTNKIFKWPICIWKDNQHHFPNDKLKSKLNNCTHSTEIKESELKMLKIFVGRIWSNEIFPMWLVGVQLFGRTEKNLTTLGKTI